MICNIYLHIIYFIYYSEHILQHSRQNIEYLIPICFLDNLMNKLAVQIKTKSTFGWSRELANLFNSSLFWISKSLYFLYHDALINENCFLFGKKYHSFFMKLSKISAEVCFQERIFQWCWIYFSNKNNLLLVHDNQVFVYAMN